jgi:hypothetical protein
LPTSLGRLPGILGLRSGEDVKSHVYDEVMARDIYDKIRSKHWKSLSMLLERLREVSTE